MYNEEEDKTFIIETVKHFINAHYDDVLVATYTEEDFDDDDYTLKARIVEDLDWTIEMKFSGFLYKNFNVSIKVDKTTRVYYFEYYMDRSNASKEKCLKDFEKHLSKLIE